MSDNYVEETKPLFKLLRTEAFRFVIVRYNHFSFVQQLEKDLKRLFPDRSIKKVDAQKLDYTHISNAYFDLNEGFFFIENFDDVLKEERDSLGKETPQYAEQNERRRGITAGLNLRRDRLAKYPIALFVFVPATTGELYAKTIMEKMPDLWSFRSWMLDLEMDSEQNVVQSSTLKAGGDLRLGDDSVLLQPIDPSQQTELNRLLLLLEKTPENEIAYRLTLYPQITDAAMEVGAYDKASTILDEWETQANENDKGVIWVRKGSIATMFGNLEAALNLFEKSHLIFEKNNDKANIAVSFERLGNTHTHLGNLDKALGFYEERNRLGKEMYAASPNNVAFKNGLAISYEKLGNTHASLGNLDKALGFYEECNRLGKELFAANPNNVAFKNLLAISYQCLGNTHTSLGNLGKALEFYEEYNHLEKELYAANPNNVAFKNGLAVSYQYLGNTHTSLGNLDKALGFYDEFNRLEKELYAANPNNVAFKNGLAISYQYLGITYTSLGNLDKALGFYEEYNHLEKELYAVHPNNVEFKNLLAVSYQFLGNTHTSLGNLDKALEFYEEDIKLSKELYAANPNNVEFKNGLAVSYYKLGACSQDQLKNKTKAQTYFKQAENLWLELVRDAPQYVKFKEFLGMVQDILKGLD
jgi:tetratricopeptide (TPR) repeat protein